MRVEGSPTLIHCTFSGNRADWGGGGISHWLDNMTVANCILWGNTDNTGINESAQIYIGGGAAAVRFSCIQGLVLGGSFDDGTNMGDNPLLVRDPYPGPDGNWDGVDDDYGDLHLQADSLRTFRH